MKQLTEMTLEELWELFPIILSAPDENWKKWANEEIERIKDMLGDEITAIHHIGSTAVAGIWAKPIIDILVETEDKCNFKFIKSRLTEAEYICMSESGDRMDFNKGYTPEGFADKVYHLHLRLTGDNDEIYFRDFLNGNPDIAKEYEKLKLSLLQPFEHDRNGYTQAKTEFIKHYTSIAKSHQS